MQVTNLKAYLAETGMTKKDFCEIIDCSHRYLDEILNGRMLPGRRLAKDIEMATSGVVKMKASTKKTGPKRDDSHAA